MTRPKKKGLALSERRESNGFTLIEILVAIAIIGILAAIGLGSFTSSRRNARDSRRLGDVKTIMNALEQYFNDNNEQYPANTPALVTAGLLDRAPADPRVPSGCTDYIYAPNASSTSYTLDYSLERISNNAIGALNTGTVGCATDYRVTR